MSNISIFNFESTKQVRTAIRNGGDIWFCLPDVANVLEISRSSDLLQVAKPAFVKNETSSKRGALDPAGVHKMYISYESGKKQVTFINEPNLYRVIFRSNKAEAVKFQNWVFDEVLPTIRKTGQYTIAFATKDERKPLVQAVNMLVGETGAIYSNVWKMIHQRFDVDCVDELTNEQVYQAVEYVHGLILQHGKKPVDDVLLYKVLVDSAVYLRDYAQLIKQMRDIRFFDENMGKNMYNFVADNINDIVRLTHDMKLTNKNGRPMFEKNRINYYGGAALIYR
ncbi:BRO family protein [Moraxella catarrhalis]|uniref:BRO-N domain-containing protein n=1 Tax=Moraxella catarrhalis TaxID=480 RepID=UPI000EA8D873|nr:BRO family protein [Moraxella catarrhalis]MPW72456.1 BRO family protein [Moraxella catarrhalis]MPW82477.1 BRO family protein [Moraxella catarrhalis]MPX14723.1 BRO family protein [Moraxella catarrhalis]MPX28279.1 BRO family protein [Moraxella catarrhalis]MPX42624.1 BRO family protein [Moraxella catarrhalis]